MHVTGRYREQRRLRSPEVRAASPGLPAVGVPRVVHVHASIAMAARLFVVCFDLGAQAVRVRSLGLGPADRSELDPAARSTTQLIAAAQSLWRQGLIPPQRHATAHYPDILTSYYDFTRG